MLALLSLDKWKYAGSTLSGQMEIESDSLIIVNCLSPHGHNFSDIGVLSFDFLSLYISFVSFSHVYRSRNCLTHHLTKLALVTDQVLE